MFAVLVAHRQLVALVRMKRLNLGASDFNMIVNMIECHSSLRDGETWVPICLPQFDQKFAFTVFYFYNLIVYSSFLHAHISYLWEGSGPCLILLSVSKDAFFQLAKVRMKIEENMASYKKYARLKEALSHPDAFSLKQVFKNTIYILL